MEIALVIGQLLLKYGPDLAEKYAALYHSKDPTLNDWIALFNDARTNADKFMEETKGLDKK